MNFRMSLKMRFGTKSRAWESSSQTLLIQSPNSAGFEMSTLRYTKICFGELRIDYESPPLLCDTVIEIILEGGTGPTGQNVELELVGIPWHDGSSQHIPRI